MIQPSGITRHPDFGKVATLCSIVGRAGDGKQGKNCGQKLLSAARDGFNEASKCVHGCFEGHSGPNAIGYCIGVNLIRNIRAMILKHRKNNPKQDKESRELDRALRHVHKVMQEISHKAGHTE